MDSGDDDSLGTKMFGYAMVFILPGIIIAYFAELATRRFSISVFGVALACWIASLMWNALIAHEISENAS